MITVSKKWIRLIGIVGCTVWMASCKQASDAGVKSSSYAVMQIEAVDKEFSSSYSATIRGRQDIDIYPQVSGTIEKLCVTEGQKVRRGQLLFVIDQVPYKAALKTATANVEAARAGLGTAELTYKSNKELYAQKVVSEFSLKTAENTYLTAKAQLSQAQAQEVSARNNLSYTEVKSPSDGVVGALPFRVGALVSPGIQQPLTTVSDNSDMYVYFSMTENQLLSLTRQYGSMDEALKNMPEVELRLNDNSIYDEHGIIESISGVIDRQTGTVVARAVFPNESRLLHSGASGNVVIPSFAVGRTQEMLYFIRQIKEEHRIHGHDNFPVFVDSPLASKSTTIFRENFSECYDAEALALVTKGENPLAFPGLQISETKEDSVAINLDSTPKVIISASGMCDAGRIRHHLKHNLWRPECTILFVGFQAVGTLGRTLIEGVESVKLFGEPIEVKAEICQLTGMSGHADKDGLLRWVNAFTEKPRRVFVIHGEDEVENRFVDTLTEQGFTACAPYNGAQWAIGAEGAVCLQEGTKVRVEQRTGEGANRAATVFQRLLSAGKRLLRVIEHNEGGANKDLAKFADQINALCDKWDR